ncbi:MAG: hypothetical protein N2C13_03990 [Chloroflexota bacterium]
MSEKNSNNGKWIAMGAMLIITVGFFWGVDFFFPGVATTGEAGENNESAGLIIEFGCNVWVEEVFAGTREDILISVASYFDSLAPLSGVEGEVTVEFPDGEKALFYLPTTNEAGMSSVSVTSSRELENIDTGRVLISIHLHTFDMVCDTETSFYVWQ